MIRNAISNVYKTQSDKFAHPIAQKIRSFQDFPVEWCYGEGATFQPGIIDSATKLHSYALSKGFLETDAFPGVNGEIRITLYKDKYYLEFTIENDESIAFSHEKDDNEVLYEEGITYDDATKLIDRFWDEIWNSSEYYTATITTQGSNDFKVWLLKTPATGVGFLYFKNSVPWMPESPFVITLANTTKKLQAILQSSGNYLQKNSLQTVN